MYTKTLCPSSRLVTFNSLTFFHRLIAFFDLKKLGLLGSKLCVLCCAIRERIVKNGDNFQNLFFEKRLKIHIFVKTKISQGLARQSQAFTEQLLSHFGAFLTADLHAQVGNADARAGGGAGCRGRRGPPHAWLQARGQAAPMSTVPQVVQLQPPTGAAHQGAHRRETLQVQLLRPSLQAALARPTAH